METAISHPEQGEGLLSEQGHVWRVRPVGHPACSSSALPWDVPPGGCTSPFLPVYALQEPEVELLLGVLWLARVVNEHQAGRRAPPDLTVGWEEVHLLQEAISVWV